METIIFKQIFNIYSILSNEIANIPWGQTRPKSNKIIFEIIHFYYTVYLLYFTCEEVCIQKWTHPTAHCHALQPLYPPYCTLSCPAHHVDEDKLHRELLNLSSCCYGVTACLLSLSCIGQKTKWMGPHFIIDFQKLFRMKKHFVCQFWAFFYSA